MSLTAWTLTTLTAALQDMVEDDGSEFVAFIPTAIGLAEDRLVKDLDLEIFDVDDTSKALVAGTRTLAVPTGYLGTRSIYTTPVGGGAYNFLLPASIEFCRAYAPTVATQGAPKYFAELTDSTIMVVPTPDAAYPVVWRHIKRPAGLSDSATYLSTSFPDALLYAALMECELYLKADERSEVWRAKYLDALPAHVRERLVQKRRNYKPLPKAAAAEVQ